jgi:hypothetical protein
MIVYRLPLVWYVCTCSKLLYTVLLTTVTGLHVQSVLLLLLSQLIYSHGTDDCLEQRTITHCGDRLGRSRPLLAHHFSDCWRANTARLSQCGVQPCVPGLLPSLAGLPCWSALRGSWCGCCLVPLRVSHRSLLSKSMNHTQAILSR